jgi:hypothetical protein
MSTAREKLVTLARERFQQGQDAEEKQRKREIEDLRFYAGEQWDSDILKSRQGQSIGSGSTQQIVPARPSLTINKTREPVRQVLNQERNADLGITVIPADDFGDMDTSIDHTEIKLREGLVRRIQRDSEAADARTWAFARSAIAGRGYWGVMTRYVPKRADQEIYVHRFYNQSAVTLDPAHEQPDGSDADWAFVGVDLSWDRYKAEFPSTSARQNRVSAATADDEWRAFGDEAPGWFRTEGETRMVRVCEYWYTERTSTTLYHLSDGRAVPKDDLAQLPDGVTQVSDTYGPISHVDVEKHIKWCKLDGLQVLDETDWPGHYIPIIKVLGEELQPYDQERRCEGIVRPMIDPCRGNNYVISKFVERVGLTPIPPWMMAAGQDEGFEEEYNAANTRTLSRLHYNQKDSDKVAAPPPFRVDARSEIADIAMGVQIFGQAITSTSVVPETALGNTQPGVKSGRMARLLIDQATQGTSNFLDNLVRSMRHEARIINDLLYPIYGRPGRMARMMNPEGEMSAVIVGQPFTVQGDGPQARPMPIPQGQEAPQDAQLYRLTPDAEFNVAVKVSKNFNTRREEEAAALGEIIAADPTQLQVVGDLFFKYQDGPGHEEMSERYKAVLLPQVQATLGKGQNAAEMQAQLAQAQQAIQMLTQQVEQQNDIIKTDVVKSNATLQQKQIAEQAENERTAAELASKERIETQKMALEMRKLEVELEIEMAKLGSAQSMARAEIEQQSLHEHNAVQQADADRQEAASQADLDRNAAHEQAAMDAAMRNDGSTASA